MILYHFIAYTVHVLLVLWNGYLRIAKKKWKSTISRGSCNDGHVLKIDDRCNNFKLAICKCISIAILQRLFTKSLSNYLQHNTRFPFELVSIIYLWELYLQNQKIRKKNKYLFVQANFSSRKSTAKNTNHAKLNYNANWINARKFIR